MNISLGSKVGNGYLSIGNISSRSTNSVEVDKMSKFKLDKDTVSISPLGKRKNILENLMKQKQKVFENKNNLIGKTLEKGEALEAIKPELDAFDEQLKTIEGEINKTLAEHMKKTDEKSKLLKEDKTNIEKANEEEKFKSLINLSSNLDKTKSIASLKKKSDGEIRVLESEIKLDESRGGASETKRNHLLELKEASEKINSKIKEDIENIKKNSIFNNNYFYSANSFMNIGERLNLYL